MTRTDDRRPLDLAAYALGALLVAWGLSLSLSLSRPPGPATPPEAASLSHPPADLHPAPVAFAGLPL